MLFRSQTEPSVTFDQRCVVRLPVEETSELPDDVFKSEEKELNNSQIKDINSRDRQIYSGLLTEPDDVSRPHPATHVFPSYQ